MFRRAIISFFIFAFALTPLTLIPQAASAAGFGIVPCALENDNPETNWNDRAPCTLCHFLIGMNFIVKLLRNIMTACAIAVIVAMALIYITSAGDEGRMSFAKEGIKWSLIGFAVILLAWVIVNFIFTLPLFANNGLVRTGWDTFTCNTTSQVTWNNRANPSGIGNSTGGVGTGGGDRGGLPGGGPTPPAGPTPPSPPSPPSPPGGPGIPQLKCGRTHFSCDVGTSSDNQTLSDRWIWLCKQDGYQKFCKEHFSGCGNGTVDAGEQCDEAGHNDFCGLPGVTCDINSCARCDGKVPPVVPPGCGGSNGTPNAPVEPLCVGGAIASSVISSAVGTGTRYDWTCSVVGMSGSFQCSSGLTNVGGNPTATCGGAAGNPTATAPASDLCAAPANLTVYGVTAINHAVSGEPLWSWSCQIGTGVATSCYAPRTSGTGGTPGTCQAGVYSWGVEGNTCAAEYATFANNTLTHISDDTPPALGSIGLRCDNGHPVQDFAWGEATCAIAAGGAACGSVQLDGAGNPIAAGFCSKGYHGPLSCTANNGIYSCTWTCFSLTGDVPPVDCSGSAVIPGGPNG